MKYMMIISCMETDVPRKGNVDRNSLTAKISLDRLRDVPRKGNVDRNLAALVGVVGNTATFPARGTWIEILNWRKSGIRRSNDVPRQGNVDRNIFCATLR